MDSARQLTLSNGVKMPIMGLGTWQLKKEEVDSTIKTAVEIGYRHFDTALVHGNEVEIGTALQSLLSEGKVKREELFITSKLHGYYHKRQDVIKCLRQSLKQLQLDHVDLFLIHTPMSTRKVEGTLLPTWKGKLLMDDVDYLDTWKGMEDVYAGGLASAIGLSNFNSRQIRRILENSTVKPHNLQVECHAYFPQLEMEKFCRDHKITITAYGPLGSPYLAHFSLSKIRGTCDQEDEFPVLIKDETVAKIAQKRSKTPSQVLLRWLLQRGIAVIPKSSHIERLKENFTALEFELTTEDMETVGSLAINKRLFRLPMGDEHVHYPFKEPF